MMKDFKRSDLTKVAEVDDIEIRDGKFLFSHITAVNEPEIDFNEGRFWLSPRNLHGNDRIVVYEVDEDAENVFDNPERADDGVEERS